MYMAGVYTRAADKLMAAHEEAQELRDAARKIRRCGQKVPVHEDGTIWRKGSRKKPRERRYIDHPCRQNLCPSCMAKEADKTANALKEQFTRYSSAPDTVHFFQFNLGNTKITGDELKRELDRLHDGLARMVARPVWRSAFFETAGVYHPKWKPNSKKYSGAGFLPHLHVMTHAIGKPDLVAIGKEYLRLIAAPLDANCEDYVEHRQAKDLDDIETQCGYMGSNRKLLPAYDRWYKKHWGEGFREGVNTERMPPIDIVHFMCAMWRRHRLLAYNFKPNRRRTPVERRWPRKGRSR